jgi:hypothetical protein
MTSEETTDFLKYYGIDITQDKRENLNNLAEYLGLNSDIFY